MRINSDEEKFLCAKELGLWLAICNCGDKATDGETENCFTKLREHRELQDRPTAQCDKKRVDWRDFLVITFDYYLAFGVRPAPPSASAARGRRLSLSRRPLAVLSHGGPLVSPRPPRSRGTCATSSTTSSRRSARPVPLAPPPGTAGGRARRCVRSWQRRLGTWLAPARRRSTVY